MLAFLLLQFQILREEWERDEEGDEEARAISVLRQFDLDICQQGIYLHKYLAG